MNRFFIISGRWVIFLPQKPLKAGGDVLLHLYYGESCFGQKHLGRLSPLVGFWLLQKQKQVEKPNQTHSKGVEAG
jgi:hypothetical protein